jgi:hypothetical protein
MVRIWNLLISTMYRVIFSNALYVHSGEFLYKATQDPGEPADPLTMAHQTLPSLLQFI